MGRETKGRGRQTVTACVSGIMVDSRCSPESLGTGWEHCLQVMMEKSHHLLIWHDMLTDRHAHQHPSVRRERLTDGSSFVYLFLWCRHLKEAEDERVAEGRRWRERVCWRGKKRRLPFEWKSYSNPGWRMSCESERPWGFYIMAKLTLQSRSTGVNKC